MTVSEVLKQAIIILKENKIQTPRLDAEILLSFFLKKSKIFLYTHNNFSINNNELKKYFSYLNRRIKKEPIAYIVGCKEFYGLNFKINKNVLIPRPETEHIVEYIISKINPNENLLDICTGSGCIPIAIKYHKPDIDVSFSDISESALTLALENYKNLIKEKPIYYLSNIFESIPKNIKYDFITTNPPYVKSNSLLKLTDEVKNYEPLIALDGGDDGLKCYQLIIKNINDYLKIRGELVMEIDPSLLNSIKSMIETTNLSSYLIIEKIIKDYSNKERVVVIKKIK